MAAPEPPEPRRPRPLLIVEDDADLEFALADLVTDTGYRTVGARDGVEALELVKRVRPFAIVLDLMMPRMDGYGFLRALRADPELEGVAVFVVTAATNVDHEEIGQVPVFRKPIDRESLVRAIRACAPNS